MAHNFIAKEISKEPQAYGIKNESLVDKLSNGKEYCIPSIIMELYNIDSEEYSAYEFINSPTEYQKDEMLNNDIKKKYHKLLIDTLLEIKKFDWYKNSVMFLSGPEILVKFFSGKERSKYTPLHNHIEESLIIRDKQDGSWHVNKL